ncbi:hypothetical protein [Thermodesulfovibrio hydrogeniphilus]
MPLAGFICPDGTKTKLKDCLSKCKHKEKFPAGRCKARPLLVRISAEKKWDGTPSETQLISGTREMLLKITQEYFVSPDRKIPAVIGSSVHSQLYKITDSKFAEETLVNDILSGTYDFYDPELQVLFDYKTWGAWKVSKIIKGNTLEQADALFETVIQLMKYKILLNEKHPSIPIKGLAIQVVSRESDLKSATEKGMNSNSPLILIPLIDDDVVKQYFDLKSSALEKALAEKWAPVCSNRESWNKRKCEKYCDVNEICSKMEDKNSSDWDDLILEISLVETAIVKQIASASKNIKVF